MPAESSCMMSAGRDDKFVINGPNIALLLELAYAID
jgi:hypothetical protein